MDNWIEDTGGHGNCKCIISHSPNEIPFDTPIDGAGEVDGKNHVRQLAIHQHNLGSLNSHVRTSTNGYADIRLGQSRGVIDACDYVNKSLDRRKYENELIHQIDVVEQSKPLIRRVNNLPSPIIATHSPSS